MGECMRQGEDWIDARIMAGVAQGGILEFSRCVKHQLLLHTPVPAQSSSRAGSKAAEGPAWSARWRGEVGQGQ